MQKRGLLLRKSFIREELSLTLERRVQQESPSCRIC